MKNNDFVEASAYIRVLEKRMLSNADVNRLIDAPSAAELLKLVSSSSELSFTALARPQDYETVLTDALEKLYELGFKLANGSNEIVDIAACKYSFHNVKSALKLRFLKTNSDQIYSSINTSDLSVEIIKSAVQNADASAELPEYLSFAVNEAIKEFEGSHDPQMFDILLDKAMFGRMLALCNAVGSDIVTGYVKKQIDFYNVKTLMRVKEMQKGTSFLSEALLEGGELAKTFYLENYTQSPLSVANLLFYKYFGNEAKAGLESYERTGNLSELEKLFDNALLEQAKKVKYVAFGPENLFGFIVAKENEIRQVRILMTGKINSVSQSALRERLRDNYA